MSAEQFVSHARNAEDVVLARALRPDEHTGFWIDVGAGDPLICSVTAAFSKRGWRGINIEPLPLEHERLCAARPNDVNLDVALGARTGRVPIDVPITTLAEIVAEHAPDVVDFVKISVEGSEREVLEGVDWSTFRPRIIVIAATEPNSTRPNHEEWEPIVLEQGYRCALFDGLNRFYSSADESMLFDALSIPANVYDDFVPYRWAEQVRESESRARGFHDRVAITLDEVAALRNDLDTAQRLTAQALGELERTSAEAQETIEQLRTELAELRDSRLYRYTSPMRDAYGAIRQWVKVPRVQD